MLLDLSFWAEYKTIFYGIVVSINYKNRLYGWRAEIFENSISIGRYSHGDIQTTELMPAVTLPQEQPGRPTILSADVFIDMLLPYINDCVIYTGAGMAVNAGVWDLEHLRRALCLNNYNRFTYQVKEDPDTLLNVIKEFARQLYETEPTDAYYLLKELQDVFNFVIATENRDMLHQKSGHKVYTRNFLKRCPIIFLKKHLLVIGLSADHSGFIRLYRAANKNKPIFVVNNGIVPSYVIDGDYYLHMNIEEFLIKLKLRKDRYS